MPENVEGINAYYSEDVIIKCWLLVGKERIITPHQIASMLVNGEDD